jgi:excisionase family DNA binding protein
MQPAAGDADRLFYPLARVAEMLSVGLDDVEALVETGELRAIRLGTPPSWRIERAELDAYLADKYEEARRHTLWNGYDLGSVADIDPQSGR